jgi:excisionase family DNA binding protein
MQTITPSNVSRAGTLLIGYDDAAARLGVSNRTLRSLVYSGALRSVAIGHRRLIAVTDLETFVEKLREGNRR